MTERGFAAQLAQDLEPEDLRMVLEVFRKDVVRLTGVLDRAAAAGDAVGFHRTCHALAGAAGAVGAVALEQACRNGMALADPGRAALVAVLGEIRALGVAALGDMTAFLATLPRE